MKVFYHRIYFSHCFPLGHLPSHTEFSSCALPCAAPRMAPSPCDQKKAEIVRLFQKQCFAETETVKAMYDLECLQVKENYRSKVQLACDDLREQELKDLAEKKRIHNAKMAPIRARHALELAEIQQQYRTVGFEPDPLPPALSEARGSMTAVSPSSQGGDDNQHLTDLWKRLSGHEKAAAGQKSSNSSNDSLDDSDESSDGSNTSIPAVPRITEEATTNATFAPLRVKRQRHASMESQEGDHQVDGGPNSSQSENEGEQDDFSDFTFQDSPMRPSRKIPKTSKRTPAQTPASSAPPGRTKNGLDQHGDDSMYSGPGTPSPVDPSLCLPFYDDCSRIANGNSSSTASQGPRLGTRRGRPEPGTYVIKAATFPKYIES